jgi:hypothetical protein
MKNETQINEEISRLKKIALDPSNEKEHDMLIAVGFALKALQWVRWNDHPGSVSNLYEDLRSLTKVE